MNTTLFCWIAPICAIISGSLFGLLKKMSPATNLSSHYRKTLKSIITICFCIALISGYLSGLAYSVPQRSIIVDGLVGVLGISFLIWASYAVAYRAFLFLIKEQKNSVYNYLPNALFLISFTVSLVLGSIKTGLPIPQAVFCAAIAAVCTTTAICCAVQIIAIIIRLLVWGIPLLVRRFLNWFND